MWFCASISSQATTTTLQQRQLYNNTIRKGCVDIHGCCCYSCCSVFFSVFCCFTFCCSPSSSYAPRSRTVITAYILLDRFVKMLLGLCSTLNSQKSPLTHTHTHTKKHAQAHTHSLTHTNTNTVIPVLLSAQSPRLASHSIGAERRRDGYVDVGGDWKIGIFSAALQRRFVVAAAVFVVSAFAIRFDNRFISVYLLSRVAFIYYYLILLRFATLRVLWHIER